MIAFLEGEQSEFVTVTYSYSHRHYFNVGTTVKYSPNFVI